MTGNIRIIICLMLCIALLMSSVSVFAESIASDMQMSGIEQMIEEMAEASADSAVVMPEGQEPEVQAAASRAVSTAFVGSAEEFIAAVSADNRVNIVLTQSFSMGDYSSNVYYSGTLDGRGYTISDLNVTRSTEGTGGLFAGLYGGTVKNLNVTGATIDIFADGDYTRAGIICGGMDNDSLISHCNVSGTVRVTGGSSAGSIFAGGLSGNVNSGVVESCTSNVDVTVDAQSIVCAGGLVAIIDTGIVRDSDFSGNILVRQNGGNSGASLQACGNGYSQRTRFRNCTVSGTVRVEIIDGYGAATGVATADHSENNAKVSASAKGGFASAAGCADGWYLLNNGTISAEAENGASSGVSVTAQGVADVKHSANKGSVSATGSVGSVYACGAQDADGHVTNSAAVSAYCENGDATAIGIYGLGNVNSSFDCVNSASVTAETVQGDAVAVGMNGCMSSDNSGSVRASSTDGKVVAQGLVNCQYSENNADVSGIYDGAELGGLSVQGLNGCTASVNNGSVTAEVKDSTTGAVASGSQSGSYCTNNARVEARTVVGNAVARGVVGSNSQNHGYIFAQSNGEVNQDIDNASAYGVGSGSTNCNNTGTVVAISRDGGAHAYGFGTGCSDCVSTGNASATTRYFEVVNHEDGSISIYHGRAFARNSTFVQVYSGNGSVSAAGGEQNNLYYFIPSNYCLSHAGMQRAYVIYKEGTEDFYCRCTYMSCGIAKSSSEDSYTEPDMPEAPEEPDELLGDMFMVDLSMEVTNKTFKDIPFSSFTYACGSLVCDDTSYGNEYGGEFTLYLNAWGNMTANHPMKLTLPDGFSFEPWSIVTEKTFTMSVTSGVNAEEKFTVYPIYMEEYKNSVNFEVSELTSNGEEVKDSLTCEVYREYGEGRILCRGSEKIIEADILNDFGVDFADCFVDTKSGFNQALANLSCILSFTVYYGDTEPLQTSMRRMGFAEGKWYNRSGLDVACYIAQKKVAKGGEVRNVLMTIVRGTTDPEEWLGNLLAYGFTDGHMNFISASEATAEHIAEYAAEYMTSEEYEYTCAYFCGHSRGGAVVDRLCYMVENGKLGEYCSSKVAYTYAAANSFTEPIADGDVHNILFMTDVVGYVPFEMHKYGTNYVVGTLDDMEVPSDVLVKYNSCFPNGKLYMIPRNENYIRNLIVASFAVRIYDKIINGSGSLTDDETEMLKRIVGFFADSDMLDGLHKYYARSYLIEALLKIVTEFVTKGGDGVMVAHGIENYYAWVCSSGNMANARTYAEVCDEWLEDEALFDPYYELKEGAKLIGENILRNYNRGVDGLKAGAAAMKEAAASAYDTAVENVNAAQQAVNDAVDAVEQAAAMALLETARKALEAAETLLKQKNYAEEALERMVNDFADTAFKWAVGPIWKAAEEGFAGHTILAVSCPVDVQLTDSSGSAVAVFDNHTLTSLSGDFYAEAVRETDFILLDENAPSVLNIVGNAEGNMNITAIRLDENGNARAVYGYLGIPVEAGETYSLNMTDGAAGGGRALVSGSGVQYDSLNLDELSIMSVMVDKTLVETGEDVVLSAFAFGGSGMIGYDYRLYKDEEMYESLGVSEENEVTYTFEEEGSYFFEVFASDESGAVAGPVRSEKITVVRGSADDSWTYGGEVFDSVIAGDNVWIGNIYGVHYDGVWLNSWEDYEVTVQTDYEGATVEAMLSEGWTDGVNFNLYGVYETADIVLTIIVHKKNVTEADYDDLYVTRRIRVLAGDDVVPPTITGLAEETMFISAGETVTIDKPVFVETDLKNPWWVGYRLTNWDCVTVADTGDGRFSITGVKPGSTICGFYAGCNAYFGDVQVSREIIVLGAGESAVDRIGAEMTFAPDQKDITGGRVVWTAQNVPTGYALSYRFDLYRNGRIVAEGEWQSEGSASFELNEIGLYEVKVTLMDDGGATAECAFTESGKMVVGTENAMVLPEALSWIADEAFEGIPAAEVRLPQGAKFISERAFADSGVKIIRIPGTVSWIADDAFEGVDDPVFVCQRYSTAANYAEEHGYAYMLID